MSFQSPLLPNKKLSFSFSDNYDETVNKLLGALPKEDKLNRELFANLGKWLILMISLIGGSFVGIFYFYVQIECQLLKSSWRLLGLMIAILPFVFYEYRKQKDSYQYSKENLLSFKSWKTMFIATTGHSIWTVATLISVNYTSVAQSYLFLNLHAIFIVGYNALKGIKVTRPEVLGSLLATFGTVFLAFDGNIHSTEGMVDLSKVTLFERIVYGDLVGILGSIAGVFYFTKNAELKYDFPVFLGIFAMSVIGFFQITIASFIFEGSTFSFDPMNGLFGVFTQDWFVLHIFIVIITGYGAYVCYVFALKYFDPLLVSIVLTLDPIVGAIVVFSLGWQSFPGPLTIIGFFVILPGVVIVTLSKSKRLRNSLQHSNQESFINAL